VGINVHDGEDTDVLWLPAARVNAPYHAQLPEGSEFQLLKGALPKGLKLEPTGEIHGLPTASQHAQLEVFALRDKEAPMVWRVELPVYPEVDRAPGPLDALAAPGPFAVATLDDAVPVASRNLSEQIRIFYPATNGAVAEGVFPVVVFHHGALLPDGHPTIFDRFDHLLRQWASYGFVVASIDAPDLVWQGMRLVNASLSNLAAMSENQRATIAHLRTRNGDASFPLAGHLAMDRVIVAGHSRGGGASILTARSDPSVVAGILIKPLDPMSTVGGETSWNTPLPAKPFLLVVAGADADLPYPMVDFLYERRSGPMVAPTVLGSLHSFTCEMCAPEEGGVPGITREEDWAVTNAYAVAFLRFVGQSDVGFGSLLFGSDGLSTHLSRLGTLVRSDRGADPLVVDDFQRGTPGRNALGLPTSETRMALSTDESSLIDALRTLPESYDFYRIYYERPDTFARSMAHRLEWAQDGASYVSALGGLDVRGRAAFVFRVRSEMGPLPGDRIAVELRDSEGKSALVPAGPCVGANGIGERFSDVIVPLAEIRDGGVDLGELDTVSLVLQGAGAVLIDDLRFE
jgi:dienelactone hydrolase